MLIEQIIEFELSGPRPLGHTCTPKTGYFHDKTIRQIFEGLLSAKNSQKAMYHAFPTWAKSQNLT